MLNDREEHLAPVRAAAAQGLGDIKDPGSERSLASALQEEKSQLVKRAVVDSLGQLGVANECIREELADRSNSVDVRKSAAMALGAALDARGVEELAEVARSSEEPGRIWRQALLSLGAIRTKTAQKTLEDIMNEGKIPEKRFLAYQVLDKDQRQVHEDILDAYDQQDEGG